MSKISVNPPSGFRDFTPAESSLRSFALETISACYRAHGFQQIFTSAAENLSTLQGKGGGQDNEKLIFKILRRGEDLSRGFAKVEAANPDYDHLADMGLRFDLTLPLARYVSRFRQNLPTPAKLFHLGPVWRADRPQKGRFREFLQCDVDVIGSLGIGAEVECLSAIGKVFQDLGIQGAEIQLNDRRLLQGVGKNLGFSPEEWQGALVALDKLDKIGQDGVLAEWTNRLPGHAGLAKLQALLPKFIAAQTKMGDWADYSEEACASLEQILANLKAMGISARFSPALVRGQDYYTGTIFEVRHPDLDGSLAGGGRYDRLLEVFGGQATPAFGGSIGFERLLLLLEGQNQDQRPQRGAQWFFAVMEEKLRPKLSEIAAELRAQGQRVDVFPDGGKKLGQQLKYASQIGVPRAVILGESELTRGVIIVKDMANETQQEVALVDFIDFALNSAK